MNDCRIAWRMRRLGEAIFNAAERGAHRHGYRNNRRFDPALICFVALFGATCIAYADQPVLAVSTANRQGWEIYVYVIVTATRLENLGSASVTCERGVVVRLALTE